MVAYAWQRDSLISLQLINIFKPYGSRLFFFSSAHKCDSLLAEFHIYINGLVETLTQRSNLTPQRAKNTSLNACGTKVDLIRNAGLICLEPFPLFSQNSKLEAAVYSELKNVCLAHHFC